MSRSGSAGVKLWSADRWLAAIVDSTDDAIFSKGLDGIILSWNDGAQQMYGYEASEVVGQHVSVLGPKDRRKEFDELLERVRRGEKVRSFETVRRRKDGREIKVSLTVSPIVDEVGNLVAASTIARDITRRDEAERALHDAKEQLEIITMGVADGITIQDAEGRLVYANQAAARFAGYDSAEAFLEAPPLELVERFDLFDEDGRPMDWADLPGRRALKGERGSAAVISAVDRRTGVATWREVHAEPILDEQRNAKFAVNIFRDVTPQHRAEERQRFLLEASRLLASSLDYGATLRQVADLTVPLIADWSVVDMLSAEGDLESVAIAHRDPEKVKWAREFRDRYPPDMSETNGVPGVIRSGVSELYPEVEGLLEQALDELGDEDVKREILAVGFRSLMIVPLTARGRTLGAITFVGAESGRRFDTNDLAFAEDLAARAALAIDNAQSYRERDYIAHVLQQSLLPSALPQIPGVGLAARYRASGAGNEVGGDFFDVFPTGETSYGLVIGDVCGKGADAAALMAVARYTVRTASMRSSRPSEILEVLNQAVLEQATHDRYCTVAYARVDPSDDGVRLTICSGGHPLPLLLRADGSVEWMGRYGNLIGVVDDPQLHDVTVDLHAGDVIVFYTDGVTDERLDDAEFGEEGLRSAVEQMAGQSAESIASKIEDEVLAFGRGEPRDDVAVVVMRVLP